MASSKDNHLTIDELCAIKTFTHNNWTTPTFSILIALCLYENKKHLDWLLVGYLYQSIDGVA
jgi:hypothetical protein